MKIVIVDDEKDAIEYLERSLLQLKEFDCQISTASSIESATEIINNIHPDLVFLDVQMPYGSGFDILKNTPEINYDVIFTTAFDHYAMKAIKYNAFDYLLKPIDLDELKTTLLEYTEKDSVQRSFNSIKDNIANISKLDIPYKNGFLYIKLDDFLYIEADGSYSTIHTLNDKFIVSKKIKYFEELLDENQFCRIHASFIINLKQLKQFSKSNGGEVILEDDTVLSVSANKRKNLLTRVSY